MSFVICPSCSRPIPDQATSCPSCGFTAGPADPPPPPPPLPTQQGALSTPRARSGRRFALGFGAVFALGIVVLVVVVTQRGDDTKVPGTSPEGLATTSTSPTARASVEIVPWDVRLRDVGDGWALGTVRLAFLNSTGQAAVVDPITITGGTVHTEEGRDYPAFCTWRSPADLDQIIESNGWSPDLLSGLACGEDWNTDPDVRLTGYGPQPLPLPPDIYVVASSFTESAVTIAFTSATQAHPTSLTLFIQGKDPVTLDLTAAPDSLPDSGMARNRAHDMERFTDDWSASVGSWEVRFAPTCLSRPNEYQAGEDDVWLPYTVQNRDTLGGAEVSLPVPHATYARNGYLAFSGDEALGAYTRGLIAHTLGPGQTAQGELHFWQAGQGDLLFVYDDLENLAATYVLDCQPD